MNRVVLVASSPRLPLLFPPQTWRALDAARPVWLLDADHPSVPALEVAEIPWEVLAPAEDTGPAGRDLLLVGQGLDMEGVALARRQADALLDHARRDGTATLLLPPVNDGPLVQLVDSGNWSAVAKQRSIDAQSRTKAGDLGFNARGATVKEFETAEYALAAQGDCKGKTSGSCSSPISQPVKTQFGYHVLQVVGVRLPELDNELRAKLEPAVKDRRQQAVQRWFEEQLKQADVTVNPRFGRWDAEQGKVVDRETAPGAATTTTAGLGGPTPTQP